MFLPIRKGPVTRNYATLFDAQHNMTLHVPLAPGKRARLTVNPRTAFDRRSFRSKVVDRATLVLACPIGLWEPGKQLCRTSQVVQAVIYRASERDRVLRDFYSGKLQKRHRKDQERLETARALRRIA